MPQVDSTSVVAARSAAAFEFVLPRWLPPRTDVVSFRWWNDGHVVEVHTTTREKRADDLTGRLTIKEWIGPASAESQVSSSPGVFADELSEQWLRIDGEPNVWLGRVGDVNVMMSTAFSPDVIRKVITSLA